MKGLGIIDVSQPKSGVKATCANCKSEMIRWQQTLDRMTRIDGFVSCSNSCRTTQLAKAGSQTN